MPTAASLPYDFFATFAEFFASFCGKDFDFVVTHTKILNRKGREERSQRPQRVQESRDAFLLSHFQYKYPGTPIDTIAAPQNASVGRVTIVFRVQAPPTST